MPKKRNKEIKPLLPVFHIYCEGKKTEPNYLKGYISTRFSGNHYNRLLKVIKIEDTNKNTPKELVAEAIKKKQEQKEKGATEDIFWVVYDREGKDKYSDHLHEKARHHAEKNNINIALSNVCFEIWILLHFEKATVKEYYNYDDLRKNSELRECFQHYGLKDYNKGGDIFKIISTGIEKARIRAKRLNNETKKCTDSSAKQPHQWNPYTDVYKLLDAIDEFGQQYILTKLRESSKIY